MYAAQLRLRALHPDRRTFAADVIAGTILNLRIELKTTRIG